LDLSDDMSCPLEPFLIVLKNKKLPGLRDVVLESAKGFK